MVKQFSNAFKAALGGAAIALMTVSAPATAHQTTGEAFPHTHGGQQRTIVGERYTPTIWVDPDGCEHWVMDDGWEGYMTLKVDRNGKPTCRGGSLCATMAGSLFEPHGAWLTHRGKQHVMDFFSSNKYAAYKIIGHTDVGGNDRSNMKLSEKRANMVAQIAKSTGARVISAEGYGGRAPLEANWKRNPRNERVEIICLR